MRRLAVPFFSSIVLVFSIIVFVFSITATAKNSTESILALANAAKEDSNWEKAVEYYRQAIDREPTNYKLHYDYIVLEFRLASDLVDPSLEGEAYSKATKAALKVARLQLTEDYNKLVKEHPKNAGYHAALGALYSNVNWEKAEQHFLETMKLAPKIPVSYESLALLEDTRGNVEGNFNYLRKGAEATPDNAKAAFNYAYASYAMHGMKSFKEAMLAFVKKFPESERAPQALFWLANKTEDSKGKIKNLNALRKQYSYKEYRWAAAGMDDLFQEYTHIDAKKALEIAKEVVNETKDKKNKFIPTGLWIKRRDYQASIVEAEHLISTGKFEGALELLRSLKQPRRVSDVPYNLNIAKALALSGDVREAYDFLLELSVAKPTDAIQSARNLYAAKLSLSPEQISIDMAAKVEQRATPIEAFSFERIDTNQSISLTDYHGKVVLLNFWYPSCGPCRGENPLIQTILAKYQSRGFEVMALNVNPEEELFVLPYMAGMNFDFIPLRSSKKFALEKFQAKGYPTNILVDTKGRKIMRLPPIHGDSARTLELQIEALLPKVDKK